MLNLNFEDQSEEKLEQKDLNLELDCIIRANLMENFGLGNEKHRLENKASDLNLELVRLKNHGVALRLPV